MNLALFIPDWNSLDSVRNAHALLELWSIWLFGGLVVCDVVAHLIEDEHKKAAKIFERVGLLLFAIAVIGELSAYKYGQRNDELSGNQIVSLDKLANEAKTVAGEAKTTAGAAEGKAVAAGTAADNAEQTVGKVDKRATQIDQALGMAQYFLSDRDIRDPDGLKIKLAKFSGKTIFFRDLYTLFPCEGFWAG